MWRSWLVIGVLFIKISLCTEDIHVFREFQVDGVNQYIDFDIGILPILREGYLHINITNNEEEGKCETNVCLNFLINPPSREREWDNCLLFDTFSQSASYRLPTTTMGYGDYHIGFISGFSQQNGTNKCNISFEVAAIGCRQGSYGENCSITPSIQMEQNQHVLDLESNSQVFVQLPAIPEYSSKIEIVLTLLLNCSTEACPNELFYQLFSENIDTFDGWESWYSINQTKIVARIESPRWKTVQNNDYFPYFIGLSNKEQVNASVKIQINALVCPPGYLGMLCEHAVYEITSNNMDFISRSTPRDSTSITMVQISSKTKFGDARNQNETFSIGAECINQNEMDAAVLNPYSKIMLRCGNMPSTIASYRMLFNDFNVYDAIIGPYSKYSLFFEGRTSTLPCTWFAMIFVPAFGNETDANSLATTDGVKETKLRQEGKERISSKSTQKRELATEWSYLMVWEGYSCPLNCSSEGQCVEHFCECNIGKQGYDCAFDVVVPATATPKPSGGLNLNTAEWSLVAVVFVVMLLFLILLGVVVVVSIRYNKKKQQMGYLAIT